jgi:hypothetical protein
MGGFGKPLDGLAGRLEDARQLARRGRLRVQLPLGLTGVIIGTVSIATSWATQTSVLGMFGMGLGPWLLLLCVLPTETRAIGLAIALAVLMILQAFWYHAIAIAMLDATGCGPPTHSERACVIFRVVDYYAVTMLGAHCVYALYLGVALYGAFSGARWLPSRPPRASLESTWRLVGSVLSLYSPVWLALGGLAVVEPTYDLLFLSDGDGQEQSAQLPPGTGRSSGQQCQCVCLTLADSSGSRPGRGGQSAQRPPPEWTGAGAAVSSVSACGLTLADAWVHAGEEGNRLNCRRVRRQERSAGRLEARPGGEMDAGGRARARGAQISADRVETSPPTSTRSDVRVTWRALQVYARVAVGGAAALAPASAALRAARRRRRQSATTTSSAQPPTSPTTSPTIWSRSTASHAGAHVLAQCVTPALVSAVALS